MTDDITGRVGALASFSLQCPDAPALADFYRLLLGGREAFRAPDGSVVAVAVGDVFLTAMRVDDYRRPIWPDPHGPAIAHLDIAVDELVVSVSEAEALGAVQASDQPAPHLFRVLLDPAGHPFCLTTARPD